VRHANDFGHIGGRAVASRLPRLARRDPHDSGCSLKPLHSRLIVTSAAYRQSSATAPSEAIDPTTACLRIIVRASNADTYRDPVLAVAGRLDLAAGGPVVHTSNPARARNPTPVLDYTVFVGTAPARVGASSTRPSVAASRSFHVALDFPRQWAAFAGARCFPPRPLHRWRC